LTIGLKGLLVPEIFHVVENLNHKVLVGIQFLRQTSCKLDMKSNMASFFDDLMILPLFSKSSEQAVLLVVSDVVVPPLTEAILSVSVPKSFTLREAFLEPHACITSEPYLVAKALVTIQHSPHRKQYTCCRVINLTQQSCQISRRAPLAIPHRANYVSSVE